MTGTVFDQLAERYDALWSATQVGRRQREAVWRTVDRLILPGESVLDLGCGTGDDALHLMEAGLRVTAIDASTAMVRIARDRGVNARRLAIEDLDQLPGVFDGALSNFGAFNCVADLRAAAGVLATKVRSGGFAAICVMGRTCAWELMHYLPRLDFTRAFRRWQPGGCEFGTGLNVRYPSVRQMIAAFGPDFTLSSWHGVGVAVPPSYAGAISEATASRLAAIDRRFAHWPGVRALADHRLLVFHRI